jgi:mono/diheme cytochrome c family protein
MRVRIQRVAGIACSSLVLIACATLTSIPALQSSEGRVYARRCSGCHGVPDPRLRTMDEWKRLLPDMERRIQERGLPPLTNDERQAIVHYLEQHSKPSS